MSWQRTRGPLLVHPAARLPERGLPPHPLAINPFATYPESHSAQRAALPSHRPRPLPSPPRLQVATRLYSLPLFQGARAPLAACLLGMLLSRLYRSAQDELGDTLFALAAANWSEWHLSTLPGRAGGAELPVEWRWRGAVAPVGPWPCCTHLHCPAGVAEAAAPGCRVLGAANSYRTLPLPLWRSHPPCPLDAPAGVVDTRLGGVGPSERGALLALWGGADLDAHSFERHLHAFLNDAAHYERSCSGAA